MELFQRERKRDAEKAKKRKENEVPEAFSNEPVLKRGRLVLPEPQITDKELDEVTYFLCEDFCSGNSHFRMQNRFQFVDEGIDLKMSDDLF